MLCPQGPPGATLSSYSCKGPQLLTATQTTGDGGIYSSSSRFFLAERSFSLFREGNFSGLLYSPRLQAGLGLASPDGRWTLGPGGSLAESNGPGLGEDRALVRVPTGIRVPEQVTSLSQGFLICGKMKACNGPALGGSLILIPSALRRAEAPSCAGHRPGAEPQGAGGPDPRRVD